MTYRPWIESLEERLTLTFTFSQELVPLPLGGTTGRVTQVVDPNYDAHICDDPKP